MTLYVRAAYSAKTYHYPAAVTGQTADRPQADGADTTPSRSTFIRGDLGTIEAAGHASRTKAADAGLLRQSAKNFVQGLVLERFAAAGDEEMEIAKVRSDRLGTVHVRFTETIHGLPVAGARFYVHADAATGEVYAVNGEFVSSKGLPVFPEIDAFGALGYAFEAAEIQGEMLRKPALTYVLNGKGDAFLAWETLVEYESAEGLERDRIFADATTGELVARHPQIHRAKSRQTYDALNGTSLPGTLVCTDGESCGDSVAQDAHDNASATYDYYSVKFGRDSIDGAGMTVKSTVHYDSDYNNAYWSSSLNQVVYGDGDGTAYDPMGGSLDIVAHELTHGVTRSESDLIYQDESGALNEALSDIFAAAASAWIDGAITADTWKIAEDVKTPGTPGDAMRYMDDPTANGTAEDYYPERYVGSWDSGGVHVNSGIADLAFVLMVQGGSHPRGKTSVVVPAIGMDKAEQIFYRAQTTYLTPSSDFAAARAATAQAAADLYGQTEVDAVHDAWCAVGVPGCPPGPSIVLVNGVSQSVSGAAGDLVYFTLEVPAGATDLEVTTSGGTSGDADLYVRLGSQPTLDDFDCRSWTNTRNETCTFAAPAAGTWHVLVYAYSAISNVTLTASFDEPQVGGGTLQNGAPVTGVAAGAGVDTFYTLEVPAGATNLVVTTSGGTGDADLYVRFGSQPTLATFDCRSWTNTNNETCTIAAPSAGTWHVLVYAYSAISGLTLTASFDEPGACEDGGTESNLSGAAGSEDRYYLDVPACATTFTVTTSGGTGDIDLYVRLDDQPTLATFDCRSWTPTNIETCTFQAPAAGRYHILVYGYSAYTGLSLDAGYE